MSARPKADQLKKLREENAKLKAENKRLQERNSKAMAKKKTSKPLSMVRGVAAIFLVSLAVALLFVGNLFFWTGNTVVKQDRWVAATQPIIKDPVVQQTMALYTTNQIFNNVDVQKNIENVLPPRADFLAPQLTTQLRGGAQKVLLTALSKPSFQDKWNQVQARQHQRLIDFATNYKGDDKISINEIFNQLTQSLKDTKLAFLAGKQLPPKVGEITVVSAPWLPVFHNVVTNIDTWRLLSIILLVLCVAGAVWLSRNRRRTIYIFSLGSAAFMAVTLIGLHVIRDRVLSQVDPQYVEGVRHIIQIVFHSLVIQTVTILLAALLVALIAWVSGNSKGARAIKKQTSLLFSGKLHTKLLGSSENKLVLWVASNKRLVQWGAVALLTLVMLLVRLTMKSLLIYALLILLAVLVVEVIGGESKQN